jgi:hypothetical protein
VSQRPLALGQQRVDEVVAGTPPAVTPIAFASWPVMVCAPRADRVALATGTLERAILPAQRMDVDLAWSGKSYFLFSSPLLSLSPSALLVRQWDRRGHTGLIPVCSSRVTLAGCIFH